MYEENEFVEDKIDEFTDDIRERIDEVMHANSGGEALAGLFGLIMLSIIKAPWTLFLIVLFLVMMGTCKLIHFICRQLWILLKFIGEKIWEIITWASPILFEAFLNIMEAIVFIIADIFNFILSCCLWFMKFIAVSIWWFVRVVFSLVTKKIVSEYTLPKFYILFDTLFFM